MSLVTVSAPRRYTHHDWPAIAATIDAAGRRHDIVYRASQAPLAEDASPFVILALLPAMKLGVPLRVAAPVSRLLLEQLDQTQDVIMSQLPDMHKIAVDATAAPSSTAQTQRGVGCFFSGGVDSTYTVLTRREQIDHLLFVHGFDIPLSNTTLRQTVAAAIRHEARALAKPVIEVETNARDLVSAYVKDWAVGIGPAAAGVAYLLSPFLHTVYMASGVDYGVKPYAQQFQQWYQAFNTPLMQIADDGREATRFQKVALLAQNETALCWLRVCYENPHDLYNCGHCPKCLHTMLSLHILGALERCATFPHTIDLQAVRQAIPTSGEIVFFIQTLAAARKLGAHPEIVQALMDCLGIEGAATELDLNAIQLHLAHKQSKALRLQLAQITHSRSWRWTAPLRAASRLARAWRVSPPWKKPISSHMR